ncbi:MAG: hypothetical protein M0R80_01755 [Proteobacteria bacterium]|jgi:hypothetical protein|nr:hypothetical protein [Pseudomonadota bacterium]
MINYLEVFTVCVNYGDFLNICISANKKHFDRWVVVTSSEDENTKNICKKSGVECVESRRFYNNGDKFNKGKALNDVINHLFKKDWVLALDADIILPADFREMIGAKKLNNDFLYGVPRKSLDTCQCWTDVTPVISPWGYFQLFNGHSDVMQRAKVYPESYPHAGNYDLEFVSYWNGRHRMLEDVVVEHMPHGIVATNWCGRRSKILSKNDVSTFSKSVIKFA